MTRGHSLSTVLALPVALALAAVAVAGACASGGNSGGNGEGSGSDGGDDVTLGDGPAADGRRGDSGLADAGASQVCGSYVAGYCGKLSACSQFLLQTQYGDLPTCQTQLLPLCEDVVTSRGNGWTGSGLQACLAAHNNQSCEEFLYAKPVPAACRPAGTLFNVACRYDAQCGTGYCRLPEGAECGNCVQRGTTGALCASLADCDGNLMCNAAGTCAPPAVSGQACSAAVPCASGLVCVAGTCAVAGVVGATCDDDAAANACDYTLGAYCSGTTCTAITVGLTNDPCGSSPPTVCFASGFCSGGSCTPPAQDGQPCDGGVSCASPSTCNTGTCGLVLASQCH